MRDGCYLYIRVSREDQANGFSPDAQLRKATRKADDEHLEVRGIYQDLGISAKSDKRPDFQRMIRDLQRHRKRDHITAVIFDNTDRLMRNLRLLLNLQYELEQLNIAMLSASEDIDTETDDGWLMFQLRGMFAERALRNLSRETKKGIEERAAQGYWVGLPPFGYTAIHKKEMAPNDDAPIVRAIFDLYRTKLYSYQTLADAINRQFPQHHLDAHRMRDTLRNRGYCGYVTCNGQEYQGKHEPLVTEEQWNQCKEIRASRENGHRTTNFTKPASKPQGLLLGNGYCVVCGNRLWQHRSSDQRITKTHRYYYRCKGNMARTCDVKMGQMAHVDQQILELLEGFSLATALQEDILARLTAEIAVDSSASDKAAIDAEIERIGEVYAAGAMKRNVFQTRLNVLQEKRAAIQPIQRTTVNLQKAAHLVSHMSELLKYATLEEQRQLVMMVFEKLYVDTRTATLEAIYCRPLYAFLLGEVRERATVYMERGTRLELATV